MTTTIYREIPLLRHASHTCNVSSHFVLKINLWDRYCYYFQLTTAELGYRQGTGGVCR